ncbi:MAG: AMP-dependent synthetase/ligase [Arthrobacter sp.]|uniref:AMP-dependent synthetase/ligase n=1 Tax=Arthrobacter sp. TaxID=1667 RepID=UPI00346CEFF2
MTDPTQEDTVRDVSTDLLVALPEDYSTSQLLVDRLARGGGAPVHAVKRSGAWVDVSTAVFVAAVRGLAKALIGDGLRPGDTVAIMSRTRYEWGLAEQAVWFAGGVSVPVYETSSPHQVEWILRDSGARRVFAEDAERAGVVASAARALGVDVAVWTFEGTDPHAGPGGPRAGHAAAGLAALVEAGHAGAVADAAVEAARTSRRLSDTATIVYTSGTTGRPKGCVMTHANFALVAANLVPHMPDVVGPGTRTLMFLPLAHVLARAVQHCCIHAGTTVAHTTGAADLMGDLASFRPTFLLAVPRIFEKLRAGALAGAEARGREGLFRGAEEAAILASRDRDARARGLRTRRPPLAVARHLVFRGALYPKIHRALGGEARYAISGASGLAPDLAHFFRGAGLCLLEGYGLTETTAPATVNTPGATRVGSVGMPIPGTAVRIADDGEVLIKGAGVFAGYHRHPEATAEAFDADGYFRTGDLGALDPDGFLTISGRKKDLLVTAGGKNVAPGPLEESVRASRLVSQVVVVGEGRPYVAAILTLDAEQLAPWLASRGLPAMPASAAARHPAVLAEIQSLVDGANATVSAAEAIRRFAVLDRDFTEESGHLTPSLKLKRQAVVDTCAADIDALYAARPPRT